MQFKQPKNNDKIYWTKHCIEKMKFYNLTPQRVLRVLKRPDRCQEAVAWGCVACMQSIGNKRKTEIWLMYQDKINNEKPNLNNYKKLPKVKQKKIITAWRYPGVSPVENKIPIPEDILNEIIKNNIKKQTT